MNVDKLLKAIQILVKEEVKKQLPTIVKEVVKREVTNLIQENSLSQKQNKSKSSKGISISKAILGEDVKKSEPTLNLTKNSIINDVLAQTKPFTTEERNGITSILDSYSEQLNETYQGSPNEDSLEEYPTMKAGIQPPTSTFDRTELASKLGYGDIITGPSPTGLGVKTGLAGLDRVLNRDNSELIKAMDRNKNFRPGM